MKRVTFPSKVTPSMRSLLTFTRGVALVGALTLIPASAAFAAGGQGENTPLHLSTTQVHHASSSGSSGILRTIIALVIVIAVIYALTRILKAVKGREQRASGDGLAQLATLPLGTNKSLSLVRSGSDIVLVGVSDSGVTAIKTYTEAEAIANGIVVPADVAPGYSDDGDGSPLRSALDGLRRLTVRS